MTTTFAPHSPHVAALRAAVSELEAVEQRARRIQAERMRVLAAAFDIAAAESSRTYSSVPAGRDAELAYRSVRAELACALRLSEAAVERQLTHAHTLTRDYPDVFDALREGRIDERHTTVIVEAGAIIGESDAPDVIARRAAYETEVLRIAEVESPNRLRPAARRLAEEYAEVVLDERHARACARRRVAVIDREDGMSDLIAHLPSPVAHAIHGRLTRMGTQQERTEQATASATAPADARPRCRDERRADLFADLLLRGAPESASNADRVHARMQVLVTDETLFAESLRIDDAAVPGADYDFSAPTSLCPAELAGVGPIDTGSARVLAATAESWDLIRQDSATGAILSVDRYRPSEAMRRLLAARDRHCRFPGCRAPVWRCDLDHTVDAARGGPTATTNLAHLCRGHHTLKHHGGWTVKQRSGGVMEWRSPTGRRHIDRPAGTPRPVRPPGAERRQSRVRFEAAAPEPTAPEPAPF